MRRTKDRTTAICIGLIIISLIGAILFMRVAGETPNDKETEYEQRATERS